MAHPDEAVKPAEEVESKLIAEAQIRHEQAGSSDLATDQEKKQAAVEQAHALSTRPDGSYAQLHEVPGNPTLAVADSAAKSKGLEEVREAEKVVSGEVSAEESDASRAPADNEPIKSDDTPPAKVSKTAEPSRSSK